MSERVTTARRGQLVLIAGLALAISLVAIALVLNSAIYTHNLASRYDSPSDGVVRSNHDVRESAGANVRYVNEKFAADGYSDITSKYTDGIPDIEAAVAEDAAVHGRLLRVSHVAGSDVEGVRIVDDEAGGSNFTSRTNESDWTVVDDAQVRGFTLRVDAEAADTTSTTRWAVTPLDTTDAFTVGLDDTGDGTDDWRVAVYENGNVGAAEINATVEDVSSGETWTCTASGAVVEVDFAAASVGSESCAGLSFLDRLSKPYDVTFSNAANVSGSYRMVADGVVDGPDVTTGAFTDRVDTANYGAHCGNDGTNTPKSTFYNASAGPGEYPRVTPALYEVAVDTRYDSESVTYEGRQRVAPGESGDPPQTPVIASFSVVEPDTDTADGNFTVSWSVTDPNGNLDTVTLDAVDDSGDVVTTTTSGETLDLDAADGPYTFTLTAQDADGNTRTASQVHDDDGGESGCPT